MNVARGVTISLCLAAAMVVLATAATRAAAADPDGTKIFQDQKCAKCHSVQTAGIAVVESKEGEAEEADDEGEGEAAAGTEEKKNPPDLSAVGTKHDDKFLTKYLNKREAIEGKKHKKRFKGKKEELDALVGWLVTLKDEAAAKAADAARK
ncbi:MAG: c-type cytochrome [Candidatus Schekmanbacteria bacterium]|nr:c-type cytochrome [Candidatus Schekmanbacteria bacterium]